MAEDKEKKEPKRAKNVLGGKSKKKKKPVHRMNIRHAASGGYIAEHQFKPSMNGPAQEPEEHAIPDMDALKAHVEQHMAEPPEEAEPQAAPAGM